MGLDIYFSKATRKAWESYSKKLEEYNNKADEEKKRSSYPSLEKDSEDYGYFRKVNFLLPFFNYEGDCEYKEISKDRVEQLIECCREVMSNPDKASELLPTQGGFFFGSTGYDSSYLHDVCRVLDWAKRLVQFVDWDNEVALMYCWW